MQIQPKFEYKKYSVMLSDRAMLGDITVYLEKQTFGFRFLTKSPRVMGVIFLQTNFAAGKIFCMYVCVYVCVCVLCFVCVCVSV